MEDNCIEIDGINYIIIDKIDHKKNIYYFLGNIEDEQKFIILKEDKDELVTLDSKEEFDEVLKKFSELNVF